MHGIFIFSASSVSCMVSQLSRVVFWLLMISANWNVRGLGDPNKHRLIMDAVSSCKPNIVCLQEMKLCHIDSFTIRRFLPASLNNFCFQPADGTRGGILMAWDSSVDGAELAKGDSSLSVAFSSAADNGRFTLTAIYAPCEENLRPDFFSSINNLADQIVGA